MSPIRGDQLLAQPRAQRIEILETITSIYQSDIRRHFNLASISLSLTTDIKTTRISFIVLRANIQVLSAYRYLGILVVDDDMRRFVGRIPHKRRTRIAS